MHRVYQQKAISGLGEPVAGKDAKANAALVFAWVGDTSQAESLADGLAKQMAEGTIMQSVILPTVRAERELYKSNPDQGH
jgi:hypothetical protein